VRRRAVLCAAACALILEAAAGAWPQAPDHGIAINQAGYAISGDRDGRLVFDGYGEAGLGGGWTAVFAFDGDMDTAGGLYVWRAGGGLRFSHAFDGLPGWQFGGELVLRYQGHESVVVDPVFAGDGLSGGVRLDAGRNFEAFGVPGFVNLGVGYTYRRLAPAEMRVELTGGLDLSPDWQAGVGLASTFAPGAFYEPGAYEKHEAQAWLRWRLDADYALSLSVAQTLAVERTPMETTIRIGLWTFFAPDTAGD
jgi:hypothetical protein